MGQSHRNLTSGYKAPVAIGARVRSLSLTMAQVLVHSMSSFFFHTNIFHPVQFPTEPVDMFLPFFQLVRFKRRARYDSVQNAHKCR